MTKLVVPIKKPRRSVAMRRQSRHSIITLYETRFHRRFRRKISLVIEFHLLTDSLLLSRHYPKKVVKHLVLHLHWDKGQMQLVQQRAHVDLVNDLSFSITHHSKLCMFVCRSIILS